MALVASSLIACTTAFGMVYVYALLFLYEGPRSISGESLYSSNYSCIITVLAIPCTNIPLLHFGYTFRNFRIIIIPCNFLKLLLSSINCISLIRRTKEISIFASRVGNVERCESDDYSIRLSNIVSRIFIYNYRRIREDDVSLLKLKYPMALVE